MYVLIEEHFLLSDICIVSRGKLRHGPFQKECAASCSRTHASGSHSTCQTGDPLLVLLYMYWGGDSCTRMIFIVRGPPKRSKYPASWGLPSAASMQPSTHAAQPSPCSPTPAK